MFGYSFSITLISVVFLALYLTALIAVLVVRMKTSRSLDRHDAAPKSLGEVYARLSQEIRFAVTPKSITVSIEAGEIIELATEVWRMEQRISKISKDLQENQLKGLESSIQKMRRYLKQYDVEIVDHKNQKYNEGLNLEILSVEKDVSLPESLVKETVEPTIILKGQVVRPAKIILLSNH